MAGGAVAWEGKLIGGALTAAVAEAAEEDAAAAGPKLSLERITRRTPTEGIAPPEGAIVLLPFVKGESPPLDEWTNKTWRTLPDGSMQVRGGDTRTVRQFGDVWLHLEFMVPFEPANRGQGRANSGVGIMDRYEVQVLDSFGLVPGKGDCASVYGIEAPRVNACLPPLRWQTFDVTFRAARFDDEGQIDKPPVMTVIHNGVIVHKDVEVPRGTGIGPREHGRSGPVRLQDHGHPVRYRNIWVVELEE